MSKNCQGFTLLEMIVALVIITIGVSAAMPSFLRQMRQGEVDRYTQQLEAGFFGLRAKLGRQKTSCTLKFENSGLENFVPPSELVEMTNNPERLECCNTEIRTAGRNSGCANGPEIGALIADTVSDITEKRRIERNRSFRLMNEEGTPESKAVEIAVNSASYELSPPGTSTAANDLIFLIRSTNTEEETLRTRCLQISGTGTVFRANWNPSTSNCNR
ncbi:type II secretion system GspH family protein [bacterium]|nr:type II secretion system GspH family protein [bacterium]